MRLVVILAAIAVFASCSKRKNFILPVEKSIALMVKRERYIEFSKEQNRPDGFVEGCDGLLFTALGAVGGMKADVQKAEEAPGKWLRRPPSHGPCYSIFSKSEISRDMIMGVLAWSLLKDRDEDVIEDIVAYAKANGHTLGQGPISRTLVTPQLYATMYNIIYKLGGDDNPNRHIAVTTPNLDGYERHLNALHLFVRGAASGFNADMYASFEASAKASEKNAFFQNLAHLSDGDQMAATNILLDESLFPDDRLPSSSEYCEPYLWQRDPGRDWEPCPSEGKIHSAADFLFSAAITLGEIP